MTVEKALSMAGRTTWAFRDRAEYEEALAVLAAEVRRLQAAHRVTGSLADAQRASRGKEQP